MCGSFTKSVSVFCVEDAVCSLHPPTAACVRAHMCAHVTVCVCIAVVVRVVL